jgi:protein lifeguard
MGIYLFAACWILFIFGILAVVFWARQYPIVNTIYSALLAILFSFFLIYDTQQIMGGKKYSISPEEHVFGAISLYVDVVYIFLAILNLGGGRR